MGPAEFVEHFDSGWRAGGPAERFLGHFLPVTDEEVLLTQPLSPPARGHAGMRRQIERLFAAAPDLCAGVHRWGATDDGVLIEFTLSGTLGGRELSWSAVDRIVLRDGSIAERRSYFDSIPILRQVLTRPRGWPQLASTLRRTG
jgi:ketosteroid isomerase-like protein